MERNKSDSFILVIYSVSRQTNGEQYERVCLYVYAMYFVLNMFLTDHYFTWIHSACNKSAVEAKNSEFSKVNGMFSLH
jgi:hypothetical protein